MRILALDLAVRTGWAVGEPGMIPSSGSLRLIGPKEPIEHLCAAVAKLIRDLIREHHPDMLVREAWLHPKQQPSGDAVIAQLLLHGAALAIGGLYGLKQADVHVATWRKHFIGRSTANPRSKVKRTAQQKQADRQANKDAVLARAKLLGYLPKDSGDYDAADALGVYDWSAAEFGRAVPLKLHLFGEERPGAAQQRNRPPAY